MIFDNVMYHVCRDFWALLEMWIIMHFEILGNLSAALLVEEIGSIPNKQDGNAMRCFLLY